MRIVWDVEKKNLQIGGFGRKRRRMEVMIAWQDLDDEWVHLELHGKTKTLKKLGEKIKSAASLMLKSQKKTERIS